MKSLAAFGRRLALSLLIALWSLSLVRIAVVFVDSGARSAAVGFADLYGSHLPNLNTAEIFTIEICLGLLTVIAAWWEIHGSLQPCELFDSPEGSWQHEAPPA